MRNLNPILGGMALAALVAAVAGPGSAAAAPAEPNAIRGVEVVDRDGGVVVRIQGTRAPAYTVFKLQDPPRLVVDLAGADVSGVPSPVRVDRGGVAVVSTAQYQDDRSSVARVVIEIDTGARYEVMPSGEAVEVKVLGGLAARPAPPAAATAPVATAAPAAPAPATELPAPAPTSSPDDHVVSRRLDESAAPGGATAVTGVKVQDGAVLLVTNGPVGTFEVIQLRDPARLAIDIPGVAAAPSRPARAGAGFTQVRFGKDGARVRVVLDADEDPTGWQVSRTARGLSVRSGAAALAAAPAAAPAKELPAPGASAPVKQPAAAGARALIHDVQVAQKTGEARIEIAGRASYAVTRPDARTLVLTFENAALPPRLERSLDTSGIAGPLVMVSCFNQPSGQVRLVATLRGEATDRVSETPRGLLWTVTSGDVARHAAEEAPEVALAAATGFAGAAPGFALSGAPAQKAYSGQRINLNFHDIDIRNLLRLLAEVSKKNVVVADDVSGKVTVKLDNVPWDQALDIVLTSKGLGKQEIGNVIRVAKYDVIAKEEAAKLEATKSRQVMLPLKVRIIPVNFSTASDIAKQVKDVLSDRGTVTVDERTNVLIVKDTQEALARAEGLVRSLDTETPGVLIESRIVEAASNFTRSLGVQWGGNFGFSPATGNGLPVAFPNVFTGTGAAGGGPTQGVNSTPNYAVNLPAAIGQGAGGGIGLVFGSANGAFNLNLRISALEQKGVVKTISAPKVATLDNKEATISQGVSIPYSQVSASGVNTTFVDSLLELKVTPHVTADGSILMKIKATNNQPNPGLTGANGQPSISKRQAETTVLVRDGDTTVIGGIYKRDTSTNVSSVPFLGDIPILGFFFRSKTDVDDHTELLIFITPRVLNRQTMMGGSLVTPAAN